LISFSDLPAVNAVLNGVSATLLISGFIAIRKGNRRTHRALMLSALGVSILFLVSYLYYHSQAGTTRFTAQGWVRSVYFIILGSHTILAVLIVPLVIATLYFAIRENFERHRRLARIALPTWLYVSVTGIVVYLMLYQWFPPVPL
jgi:putative membrane protein